MEIYNQKEFNMIDEIKNQLNILELAKKLGLKIFSNCFIYSIYKSEKNPSLKLYPDTNSFYCFSTNQGGDIIKFYKDYFKITTKEAIKELAHIYNLNNNKIPIGNRKNRYVQISQTKENSIELLESEKEYFEERTAIIEFEGKKSRKEAEDLTYSLIMQKRLDIQVKIYTELFNYCTLNGIDKIALNYLGGKERALSLSAIKYFKLFYISEVTKTIEFLKNNFTRDELLISGLFTSNDFFVFSYHRIIIPYIENGIIKYLRGRYFNNGKSFSASFGKYIGLYNFSKNLTSKRFYNIDLLHWLSPFSDIIITEGEFDCIILNQFGYNSIAIPGVANFPKDSIHLLNNYNIYLCFDNDLAGERAIQEISSFFNKPIKYIKLKNYKDITEYVYGTIKKF